MPFPDRLLGEDEEVVLEVHPHWSVLGWPLVSLSAVIALAIVVAILLPDAPVEVLYACLALVAVSLLWLAARWLRRSRTSTVITTGRLVRISGVLSRWNLEIRFEQMNQLSYHQSVGGRILGEGRVLVEVGGTTGVVVLDHVPRPAVFQSVLSEQVTRWHRSARSQPRTYAVPDSMFDTPPAGVPLGSEQAEGPRGERGWDKGSSRTETAGAALVEAGAESESSAVERLLQLDELHRRGFISAHEFAAKREEVLREL